MGMATKGCKLLKFVAAANCTDRSACQCSPSDTIYTGLVHKTGYAMSVEDLCHWHTCCVSAIRADVSEKKQNKREKLRLFWRQFIEKPSIILGCPGRQMRHLGPILPV